jgi:hypothetical protein
MNENGNSSIFSSYDSSTIVLFSAKNK